jgi:transcriptional regulator with XRE-family HTH domain
MSTDDPRHWAQLLSRARLRKGWSYRRLATAAGLSEPAVIHACLTGRSHATTVLKLANVLGLLLVLPPPPPVLTAREAQGVR